MKNGENCDILGPKDFGDIQSAKGGTLREGGGEVANNFSASDFSTTAHGASASSVREGEGERKPFALRRQVRQPDGSRRWVEVHEVTARRRARVRAYMAAMYRLAGSSGRSWGLPLLAAARWASLMVERDQATAVDELGREWRSAVASLALGGDERGAHWMVMGCALSALAAASLGLLVESAELLPLPEDGRAAWDAWAAAVDPAAMLWARHAFGWLPGRPLPCADVVFESCGGGR